MRAYALFLIAGISLAAFTAQAGTVTVNDGHVSWESTRCVMPPVTPSVTLPRNPETSANDMNAHVAAADSYTQTVQKYSACVGQEAQADANTVSQAIVAAAQASIDRQQKAAASVNAPLRP